MKEFFLRDLDLEQDRESIDRIDTSFETDVIYRIDCTGDSFNLIAESVSPPIQKRFPIDRLDLGERKSDRQSNYVIADGQQIVGFIASRFESWNKRLVVDHFYVDAANRRRGFGRMLMERAFSDASTIGASAIWLETSNLNYPGVVAYRKLGFQICGFDLTLYKGTINCNEVALFSG